MISELGGAARLLGPADARAARLSRPADARAGARDDARGRQLPHAAHVGRRAREHPQHGGRRGLAPRRAPRGGRGRARARDPRAPRRRAAAQRDRRAGTSPAEIGALFDTVTLCLSKGLGCPLGALIAGSAELMERARRGEAPLRRRDAAGRHRRSRRSLRARPQRRAARGRPRARPPPRGGVGGSRTADRPRRSSRRTSSRSTSGRSASGSGRPSICCASAGVLLSRTMKPGVLRAVTHLDIDDDDVAEALELVPRTLGSRCPRRLTRSRPRSSG